MVVNTSDVSKIANKCAGKARNMQNSIINTVAGESANLFLSKKKILREKVLKLVTTPRFEKEFRYNNDEKILTYRFLLLFINRLLSSSFIFKLTIIHKRIINFIISYIHDMIY